MRLICRLPQLLLLPGCELTCRSNEIDLLAAPGRSFAAHVSGARHHHQPQCPGPRTLQSRNGVRWNVILQEVSKKLADVTAIEPMVACEASLTDVLQRFELVHAHCESRFLEFSLPVKRAFAIVYTIHRDQFFRRKPSRGGLLLPVVSASILLPILVLILPVSAFKKWRHT